MPSSVPVPVKIDIDVARQREILDVESRIGSNNFFEVLGVESGATPEVIKEAFHGLSRKFHPDKYFGKELGPFRPKLEKIFKRIIEANQTLSDPEKRKAYLESNPFVRAAVRASSGSTVAHVPTPVVAEPKSADEAARDAERRARLARHPYLAKNGRTQDLLRRAKEHIAKSEFSHAFTQLNLAAQYDEQNPEVKALLGEVRKKNDEQRSETDLKRGLEILEKGDEHGAVKLFRSAVNANAKNHVAAYKASVLMEKHGADVKDYSAILQKAVEADPKNVEYRVNLGRVLFDAGMKALAKKHFEEAIRLAPEHPEVKKHVKKRWPF